MKELFTIIRTHDSYQLKEVFFHMGSAQVRRQYLKVVTGNDYIVLPYVDKRLHKQYNTGVKEGI